MTRYILSLPLMLVLLTSTTARGQWEITEVTNVAPRPSYFDVSGSNVVWEDSGRIMLYDGSEVRQLPSDGHIVHGIPRIDGENVVWWGEDGVSNQIYLYDGATTQSITDYDQRYYAQHYQITGSKLVWNAFRDGEGWDGTELFTYDVNSGTTTRITDNQRWDGAANVEETHVAWIGQTDPVNTEMGIFLFDGNETVRLDDQIGHNAFSPTISLPHVVWSAHGHIFQFDVGSGITTQLTQESEYVYASPLVSPSHSTWVGYLYSPNDNDREDRVAFFYYDGDTTSKVVEDFDDNLSSLPSLSGRNLVWSQWDGNDDEIYLYDGQQIHQITDNDFDDFEPRTSGGYLAWVGIPDPARSVNSIFTTRLSGLPGDFNRNGILDVVDIDLLSAKVRDQSHAPEFDLNGDSVVDSRDRARWVHALKSTYFGDANLDGEFDSNDLVAVFLAGQYNDGVQVNSGWAEGDWDGDGDFTSGDLMVAFQDGGYRLHAAVQAVPEPAACLMCIVGLLCITIRRRRIGM